jgi:hypothetical protein
MNGAWLVIDGCEDARDGSVAEKHHQMKRHMLLSIKNLFSVICIS